MITILPEFYNTFQCKADKCQHSCCKGWEIDIDDYTAEHYLAMPGKLGDDLRANILDNGLNYYFAPQGEGKRCPFLREDGLCRIILETSEENLCDICTMHPRFFGMANEEVELGGLGLCCEKTCELLLADDTPLTFTLEDNPTEVLTISDILQKLGTSLKDPQLHFQPTTNETELYTLLDNLTNTEAIDELWPQRLDYLKSHISEVVNKAKQYQQEYNPLLFDKIYQYILYRQLEIAKTYPMASIISFVQQSTLFIFVEAAMTGDLHEALRRWSEEIEYSTENVELLLEK